MPQAQPIVSAQTDGRSSQFQRRWEATYHWRSMCSMLLGNPALRAAWPMSVVDYVRPECTDISGHGYDLQSAVALGNVLFGHDPTPGIAPVAVFSGAANSYLLRADGGAANWADIAIVGGDLQIQVAQRGLSLGGWFWWTALPGAVNMLLAKDDVGANRQYSLYITAANTLQFFVMPGAVFITSVSPIVTGWNHCAGIYDQTNQDLHVVLNGVMTSNLGAAPAALADTGSPFTIGADSVGGNRFTGYGSDAWLCACALRLGFVRAAYHYTKAAFGVK